MESEGLKIILVLDDISRQKMKTNVSELARYGLHIISDLNNLERYHIEDTKTVVILENYIASQYGYHDICLYKETLELELVFLGVDSVLLDSVQHLGKVYKVDTSEISYDKLKSIITNDYGAIRRFEAYSSDSILVDMARKILADEASSADHRKLAESYLGLLGVVNHKQTELEKMRYELDSMTLRSISLENNYKIVRQLNLDLVTKAVEHNRTIKQYEVIFSKDIYEKINLSRYPNRPKIVYLKEYEELIYQNSFIMTLFEVFRIQQRQSVKVLRLYDSAGSMKVMSLPGYYKIIHNKFTKTDVVSNDFVAKVGAYKEIMDILLTNYATLDVLVVVDCKSHKDTVIPNSTIQLGLCKSEKRLHLYDIDTNSAVVNFGSGDLTWDHYPELKNMDRNEQFLFMSSRAVFQKILNILKNSG